MVSPLPIDLLRSICTTFPEGLQKKDVTYVMMSSPIVERFQIYVLLHSFTGVFSQHGRSNINYSRRRFWFLGASSLSNTSPHCSCGTPPPSELNNTTHVRHLFFLRHQRKNIIGLSFLGCPAMRLILRLPSPCLLSPAHINVATCAQVLHVPHNLLCTNKQLFLPSYSFPSADNLTYHINNANFHPQDKQTHVDDTCLDHQQSFCFSKLQSKHSNLPRPGHLILQPGRTRCLLLHRGR